MADALKKVPEDAPEKAKPKAKPKVKAKAKAKRAKFQKFGITLPGASANAGQFTPNGGTPARYICATATEVNEGVTPPAQVWARVQLFGEDIKAVPPIDPACPAIRGRAVAVGGITLYLWDKLPTIMGTTTGEILKVPGLSSGSDRFRIIVWYRNSGSESYYMETRKTQITTAANSDCIPT